jgi:hypothetical protein
VSYGSAATRITVYEYDQDLKTIPNDLSGEVRTEFRGAKDAIVRAAESGTYTDLKTVTPEETVVLGGPKGRIKALHASYTFRAAGAERNSHVYLFTHGGKFIKIRVTRTMDAGPEDDEAYARFLASIDELFSAAAPQQPVA